MFILWWFLDIWIYSMSLFNRFINWFPAFQLNSIFDQQVDIKFDLLRSFTINPNVVSAFTVASKISKGDWSSHQALHCTMAPWHYGHSKSPAAQGTLPMRPVSEILPPEKSWTSYDASHPCFCWIACNWFKQFSWVLYFVGISIFVDSSLNPIFVHHFCNFGQSAFGSGTEKFPITPSKLKGSLTPWSVHPSTGTRCYSFSHQSMGSVENGELFER